MAVVHYKPLPGFMLACGLTMGHERATGNTPKIDLVTCPECLMAKKQSSPKASTIAGRILNELETQSVPQKLYIVRVDELKTLCASVLSQDETKGQKHAPRKRKTS